MGSNDFGFKSLNHGLSYAYQTAISLRFCSHLETTEKSCHLLSDSNYIRMENINVSRDPMKVEKEKLNSQ